MRIFNFVFNYLFPSYNLHNNVSISFAGIEDEFAQEIEWTPHTQKSNKKPWRKLKKINYRRLEYKKTIEAYILSTWFFPIIYIIIIYDVNGFNNPMAKFNSYFSLLGITVLLIIILYASIKPKVFDKTNDYYGYSYKKPRLRLFSQYDIMVKLNEIYAIQLIPKYNRPLEGGGWSYYNFELNLVLENKKRMNVIVHSDLTQLRADADWLSEFLEVPVWDVILEGI